MRTLFTLLLLVCLGCPRAFAAADEAAFASLPNWYSAGAQARMARFDSRAYLALAAGLQALPREEALTRLRAWALRPDGIKVVVLCRLLFSAKPDGAFREPRLGWGNDCPRADGAGWPLSPIALVDGIPFLVSPRFSTVADAESAAAYLSYCEAECGWSEQAYAVPGQAAFEAAQARLCELVGGPRKGVWHLYFREQLLPLAAAAPGSP